MLSRESAQRFALAAGCVANITIASRITIRPSFTFSAQYNPVLLHALLGGFTVKLITHFAITITAHPIMIACYFGEFFKLAFAIRTFKHVTSLAERPPNGLHYLRGGDACHTLWTGQSFSVVHFGATVAASSACCVSPRSSSGYSKSMRALR